MYCLLSRRAILSAIHQRLMPYIAWSRPILSVTPFRASESSPAASQSAQIHRSIASSRIRRNLQTCIQGIVCLVFLLLLRPQLSILASLHRFDHCRSCRDRNFTLLQGIFPVFRLISVTEGVLFHRYYKWQRRPLQSQI